MAGLFDDFGFDFEAVENEAVKVEEKKEEKKAEKKAEKKPSEKDVLVTLPVTVKLPGLTQLIEGSGEVSIKKLFTDLYKEGYTELSTLGYKKVENTIYLGIPTIKMEGHPDTVINLVNRVSISNGNFHQEYKLKDFNNEDEVELQSVVAGLPDFEHAEWLYNAEYNVLFPYYRGTPKETTEKSLKEQGIDTLVVFGESIALSADSDTKLQNLITETPDGCKWEFGAEGDKLYATLVLDAASKNCPLMDDLKLNKGATPKKAEEKYNLSEENPLKLWLYNFNISKELRPSDVKGKTTLTSADVKKYLSEDIKAFSDSSRSFDFIYQKSTNTLSVGVNSGKKGAYEEDSDDERVIVKDCPMCRRTVYMNLSKEEYENYLKHLRREAPIQTLLPDLMIQEREFLLSNYCLKCQELLFGRKSPKKCRVKLVPED